MPEGGWREERVKCREILFLIYKITDLPFAAMISSLSYCLSKELRQDFPDSPNKTGISSGKTS